MTYKQRVKAFQKEIGFIIRNEKYYKILYADFDTKRMVIKEVDKENPKNTTEYEVLSKDWVIEINNKTITPDEYFLQNCESKVQSLFKAKKRAYMGGKLPMRGYYSYVAPDMYAFCEYIKAI